MTCPPPAVLPMPYDVGTPPGLANAFTNGSTSRPIPADFGPPRHPTNAFHDEGAALMTLPPQLQPALPPPPPGYSPAPGPVPAGGPNVPETVGGELMTDRTPESWCAAKAAMPPARAIKPITMTVPRIHHVRLPEGDFGGGPGNGPP